MDCVKGKLVFVVTDVQDVMKPALCQPDVLMHFEQRFLLCRK